MNDAQKQKEAMSVFKTELKSVLIALGIMLIGGIMIVGAIAAYILPVLSGDKPHLILACVLGIPGAIIELIGDFKFMDLKAKAEKRKMEQLQNK